MTKRTFEYWIETGRTNGQFTLHRRLVERPTHWAVKEYTYIRNIGRIYEEAVERADKYIDENHPSGFGQIRNYDREGGGELRHAGQYDDDQLWFGKYAGKFIDDMLNDEKHTEYLRFIRDNFARTVGNPRMDSLLKKLDELELGESEIARRAREAEERRERETAEYEASKQPIPTELKEGRHTFTGKIIATYTRDTHYGIVDKMIFEDDRKFRLVGTAPRALWNNDDRSPRGCEIKFDAAINISDDDEAFGFIRRPTKLTITKEARN